MKPDAVAAKIRTDANENLQYAKKGLREVEAKIGTIATMENITEQVAGILMRGNENCRKELKEVSELSSTVLDEVSKYLAASKKGDSEEMQQSLQRIADAESEIESCSARVRGIQRRLQALSERIEVAG